jgi:hypothetical protein
MSSQAHYHEPDMQQMVTNWYQAAKGEKPAGPTGEYFEIYLRFMAIWVGFCSLYEFELSQRGFDFEEKTRDGPRFKKERDVFGAYLKNYSEFQAHHDRLMKEDRGYFDAADYLAKGVKSVSYKDRGLNEGWSVKADVGNVSEIINVIYVIRNNVFHGHKQRADDRNNKLVQMATEVLVKLLGPALKKNSFT